MLGGVAVRPYRRHAGQHFLAPAIVARRDAAVAEHPAVTRELVPKRVRRRRGARLV